MQSLARVQAKAGPLRTRTARTNVVAVKALFGNPDKKSEAKKDAAFEAQQEVLAARRARRDAINAGSGPTSRREARESYKAEREALSNKLQGGAASPAKKQAPPPKQARREEVYEEEEEEEAPKSNPLSGLLGGLFGKK